MFIKGLRRDERFVFVRLNIFYYIIEKLVIIMIMMTCHFWTEQCDHRRMIALLMCFGCTDKPNY